MSRMHQPWPWHENLRKSGSVCSQLAVWVRRVHLQWAPSPMEAEYKVCDTTSLWDTLDSLVRASRGERRSYNKKSGSENECPLEPQPVLFMLYFSFLVGVFFFFAVHLFLVNSAVTPSLISVHLSTGKHSANAFPIQFQRHGVGIWGVWKPISTHHSNGNIWEDNKLHFNMPLHSSLINQTASEGKDVLFFSTSVFSNSTKTYNLHHKARKISAGTTLINDYSLKGGDSHLQLL